MRAAGELPRARWAAIRLFAMDVDGVLTDGTVLVGSDGTEAKRFSILDGLGLRRVAESGVVLAWISGRRSGATALRAKELGIPHVVQGCADKLGQLRDLAGRLGIKAAECLYAGDDLVDAPALRWAGVGAAVPAAHRSALEAADCVTRAKGGKGAVRELCDLILEARSAGRDRSPSGPRAPRAREDASARRPHPGRRGAR